MLLFVIALTLVGWQALRARRGLDTAPRRAPPLSSFWGASIVLLGLPLSALAQNLVGLYGALHVTPLPESVFSREFPLHLLAITPTMNPALRNPISVAEFAIAAAQSYMLWRLLGASAATTTAPRLAAGAALLAIVSLGSPLFTSSDPYFYVGAGILGFRTYDPPHMPFAGEFAPLNYQFVVDGTTYGPIWVALNTLIVACGHTFLQKLEALRVANAVVLLSSCFVLTRLGVERSIRCIFLLNPYLWFFLVATPHNDIFAIFFVIAAIAIAARTPVIATLLISVAGMVKLPFLLFGAVAFAKIPNVMTRCLAAASSIAICLAISWFIGGHGYLRALLHFGKSGAVAWHPTTAYTIGVSIAVFSILSLVAVLWRIWFPGAALLAAATAPAPFPWYGTWGFPYVLTEKRYVGILLAAYPLIAFALEDWYVSEPYAAVAFALILAIALRDLLAIRSKSRPIEPS